MAADLRDAIALAAVVVDESERFALQRADVADEKSDCHRRELATHAARCKALYLKLCALSGR